MPRKNKEARQAYHKEYHQKWYIENRSQQQEEQKKRRREIREWYAEYKSTLQCSRCSENHPACIDFHHRDDKNHLVSKMASEGASKERILKEISLCDILCSNCHRKEHWLDRGKART